jgi:outer membrane protein TolC
MLLEGGRSMSRAIILSLVFASAVRAQPAYSLDEALAYARDHQPLIRRALAELVARQREAKIPRAQWFPQLGAAVELLYGSTNNTTASYLGAPHVDLPRIGATRSVSSTDWTPSASTLAALTLDQEVYDFGRIAAQAAVADSLVALGRAQADAASLDVELGVEEAFHGVLAAREVLRATEDALKRAEAHRDYARSGVRSGLHPPIELTRAQADVAQLEVKRVRAQAGLREARAALAAGMGSDQLEADAKEAPASDRAAPAFEEALHRALSTNPEIANALARIDTQHQLSRAIFHEMLPNLSASATLSGRAGGAAPSSGGTPYGDGWLPDVGNWHLGLVLQWNLFDATVLARRAAAQAREQAERANLELIRSQLTLIAQRSWLDLDTATRALPGLEQSLQAAEANQAQAEARFRAGLGTVVELADAEALLTNAQLELAVGRFTVARARAALGRVLGERRNDK